MIFLPIVDRELRVAARRKATRRVRLWTTVAALGVSLMFMAAYQIFGGQLHNLGRTLFAILSYYAFGLAELTGILLTADCLSEEKRDGTLGLLFLTDLNGYDVVLGKMLAVGLSALYGLLAAMPVLGLPLLMGGVTGDEFWRTAIALVNALFFSLTLGMMVSSWSRDALKAMGNTLALLVAATVGAPFFGWLASRLGLPHGFWYWTAFSPFYPFTFATYTYGGRYWISLLISHAVAWTFLLLASVSLPWTWQDRPFRARFWSSRQGAVANVNPVVVRVRLRTRIGDENPVVWLMSRHPGIRWRMWLLAIAGSGILLLTALVTRQVFGPMGLSLGPALIFAVLIKILFAFQACRVFVEGRRTGALDLLLSTPITGREIIKGQWLGLKRLCLWPIAIFVAAQTVGAAIQIDWNSGMGGLQLILTIYPILKFVMGLAALGWLGMWLGLTAKKPNLSPALTILFGMVLPGVAFCIPAVVSYLGIILWSRARLLNDFRRAALPEYHATGARPVFRGSSTLAPVAVQ
jgi:ABC-type transport system involved in multi-copper enzyme maturation permease subunit